MVKWFYLRKKDDKLVNHVFFFFFRALCGGVTSLVSQLFSYTTLLNQVLFMV